MDSSKEISLGKADAPSHSIPLPTNQGAVYNESVVLRQHQSILSKVQDLVDDPARGECVWLDLACGRGQIIARLDTIIGNENRAKIRCYLFDGNGKFLLEAEQKAKTLGFLEVQMQEADLALLETAFPSAPRFDLVSFTNTWHEVNPYAVPKLLIDAILRLSEQGCLYIYDMEQLPESELELGAITWSRTEVQDLINTLLDALGESEYRPTVGQWPHSKCTGWNLQISRAHLQLSDDQIRGNRDVATAKTVEAVSRHLLNKFGECDYMLETLRRSPPQSREEKVTLIRSLFDYYVLRRATEEHQ